MQKPDHAQHCPGFRIDAGTSWCLQQQKRRTGRRAWHPWMQVKCIAEWQRHKTQGLKVVSVFPALLCMLAPDMPAASNAENRQQGVIWCTFGACT